jgi:hypothetical protein
MTADSASHNDPRRVRSFFVDVLGLEVIFLGLIIAGAYFGWQNHKEEKIRESEAWISKTSKIADPWQRFEEAALHSRPDFSEKQWARVLSMQTGALARALEQRSETAFNWLDDNPREYEDFRDKYPRHPQERARQLELLRMLWPRVSEIRVQDRLHLVRMAERCHLHEAHEPIVRKTVLDCLYFGARSLGNQGFLTDLLDGAELGQPRTDVREP